MAVLQRLKVVNCTWITFSQFQLAESLLSSLPVA